MKKGLSGLVWELRGDRPAGWWWFLLTTRRGRIVMASKQYHSRASALRALRQVSTWVAEGHLQVIDLRPDRRAK